MNPMYNKTDNPKRKAGRAVPLQDRHNHSFKSGLLSRLCCAALALLLAFGGVSALRGSFDGLLPVVHAETHWDRTIATGATNKEFDDAMRFFPDELVTEIKDIVAFYDQLEKLKKEN